MISQALEIVYLHLTGVNLSLNSLIMQLGAYMKIVMKQENYFYFKFWAILFIPPVAKIEILIFSKVEV